MAGNEPMNPAGGLPVLGFYGLTGRRHKGRRVFHPAAIVRGGRLGLVRFVVLNGLKIQDAERGLFHVFQGNRY